MIGTRFGWLLVLGSVQLHCGASEPKQVHDTSSFRSAAETSPKEEPVGESRPTNSDGGPDGAKGLTPDQKKQIEIALRRGSEKSAHCASVVPTGPRGKGDVVVVFDGTKGRSVDAKVGAPFAGTPVEACIKRAFIGEIVLPFGEGTREETATVSLPEKAAKATH